MIRGTTATFKFNLPHKLEYIREANVVFWQDNYTGNPRGSLPLYKHYEPANTITEGDPNGEKNELAVVLTSAETMLFTDQLKLRVQVKAVKSTVWAALNNAEAPPSGETWQEYVTSLGWNYA